MPRPKATIPKYLSHISGQARVYLDGRYFYLGRDGSPESRARYRDLCNQYEANGFKMPAGVETRPGADAPVTVQLVTAGHREWAKEKYPEDPARVKQHESLCDLLDLEYGDVPVAEFGPVKLRQLRETLVASKNRQGKHNTRGYINYQVRVVVRIFKLGVSREIVPASVLTALQTLEPLTEGESRANESTERECADLDAVRLTAEHLSPVLKAMVCIQVATGMRPSELFRMRPTDIDRQDDKVWIYRPSTHKTKRHTKHKQVPIVDGARDALAPFMDRDPEDFCFKPAESAEWYREQRSAKRATPANQGNRPGYNADTRAGTPKPRQYNESFNKDSYRRGIERAAKAAKVPHWTPYQLRHTAATAIREALGIEVAQALLGHSKRQQTEEYARQSLNRAIEAARAAPKL